MCVYDSAGNVIETYQHAGEVKCASAIQIVRPLESIAETQPQLQRERENFNHALFALAFFSRRQDRELPGAISRGLLDCPRRV